MYYFPNTCLYFFISNFYILLLYYYYCFRRPPYDPSGQQANRPSSWNHPGFFNQPATTPTSSLPPQSLHKGPQQPGSFQGHPGGAERRPPEQKGTARPRESRDSPPDVGLQIDESD